MFNIKRLFSLALTALFIMSAAAAQDAGGGTQRQNRIDLNLNSLKDTTGSEGMDKRNKMLKDIGEAVAGGDISDDIYAALDYMSKEGLANRIMRQGQLLNNFPTVRQQVAVELGKIGTARAADILIQLCRNETVPYVQWEVIRALGDIGINENDTTVTIILFKIRGINEREPDADNERIIRSAIDAFDKIDIKNNGLANQSKQVQEFLDNAFKNKKFPRRQNQVPVDERAKQVLEEMLRRETQRKQGS
jgi:HEAT repeat protein